MSIKTPEEIILFWFSKPIKKLWFNSDLVFDQEISILFRETYLKAKAGELSDWEETPAGALALVLCLDQFPRNMFRNSPEAFATDTLAREIADRAIRKGFDKKIGKQESAFLYMPFMHSENAEDQAYAVELYQKRGLSDNLEYAVGHKKVIDMFGRFPHRNKILGRKNSAGEESFLKSGTGFKGK